jgi:hypothetical protein
MADEMTPCSVAVCPFCAASVAHTEASRDLGCPIWRCSCGAVGVGASPWDIDEALDELEVTVGLRHCALGTTPAAPVGESGFLHATYIDPPAMLAAAVASAPPGWRVGSSSATAEVRGLGDPTWVRLRELIVVWAIPRA